MSATYANLRRARPLLCACRCEDTVQSSSPVWSQAHLTWRLWPGLPASVNAAALIVTDTPSGTARRPPQAASPGVRPFEQESHASPRHDGPRPLTSLLGARGYRHNRRGHVHSLAVIVLGVARNRLADRRRALVARQSVEKRSERNGDIVKVLPELGWRSRPW